MVESSPLVARELAKLAFSVVLALGSLGVAFAVRGKPLEVRTLRGAVLLGTAAKAVIGIALYLLLPAATALGSDAALHYLPETLRFLGGELPYRDFRSAYAPLFHVLLMPGVLIWRSPGAVVATIFALETAMLALYARRFARARPTATWRALFLYCFSPISCYWVAATGYNSVLVALFAMTALLLADAGRDRAAGLAALLGLAFSKLTVVIAWPAIVLFPRGSLVRRAAPLLVLAALVPLLALARMNLLGDVVRGAYLATSGNLWFLVSLVFAESLHAPWLKLASLCSLAIALGALSFGFLARGRADTDDAFDRASALLAACGFAFMILAYKTFPWYHTMSLVFWIHTLVTSPRTSAAAWSAFAALGCLTTLDAALSVRALASLGTWQVPVTVAVDVVLIAANATGAWLCASTAFARAGSRLPSPAPALIVER